VVAVVSADKLNLVKSQVVEACILSDCRRAAVQQRQQHQQEQARQHAAAAAPAVSVVTVTSADCGQANHVTAFRKIRMPSPSPRRPLRVQCGCCVANRKRSGCGINPRTLPVSSQSPAILASEPLGFSGSGSSSMRVGSPEAAASCAARGDQ